MEQEQINEIVSLVQEKNLITNMIKVIKNEYVILGLCEEQRTVPHYSVQLNTEYTEGILHLYKHKIIEELAEKLIAIDNQLKSI